MSKDKIADYDGTTAGNNTDIGGISIAEGMLPSAVNNSMRELTKQLGAFANGTDAIDALTVTGAATVNGAFTSPGIDDNADATAITIDSSENVLIGDASPQVTSKLTVSGNGSADTATFMYDGTAGTYLDINTNAANGIISLEANARSGNYPPLTFITSGSERLRIQSGGGISFNGDTAAANALDDYEEGTFTPQLLGGTSNPSSTVSGSGEYVKVGKLVFIYIKFHNVNTTGASGYIRITGQPFNPSQTNGPLSMSSYDFDFSGRTSLTAEINNGEINGVTSGDDTGWGLLNFGAGTSRYIFIAGTYRVA